MCGQQFVLKSKAGAVIATPTVSCTSKGRHGQALAKLPELYAVMSLCATPCMIDPESKCCFVPEEVAWMFPCCRALGCCPDEQAQPRRALGQQQPRDLSPRALPGVSVSVSVSVEETSSSKTTYKKLMQCLENNPGDSSVCQQRQGNTGGAPTSAPTAARAVSVPGTRRLSGAQAAHAKCLHGGTSVTCRDGVKNADEVMTDCGGSACTDDAAVCAAAARAVAAAMRRGQAAGRSVIATPHDLLAADLGLAGVVPQRCDDERCLSRGFPLGYGSNKSAPGWIRHPGCSVENDPWADSYVAGDAHIGCTNDGVSLGRWCCPAPRGCSVACGNNYNLIMGMKGGVRKAGVFKKFDRSFRKFCCSPDAKDAARLAVSDGQALEVSCTKTVPLPSPLSHAAALPPFHAEPRVTRTVLCSALARVAYASALASAHPPLAPADPTAHSSSQRRRPGLCAPGLRCSRCAAARPPPAARTSRAWRSRASLEAAPCSCSARGACTSRASA